MCLLGESAIRSVVFVTPFPATVSANMVQFGAIRQHGSPEFLDNVHIQIVEVDLAASIVMRRAAVVLLFASGATAIDVGGHARP